MRQYSREEDALQDVLRLSEGMTYKNAAAGLPLGGGKAVIIGDPLNKTTETLRLIGRAVDHFDGSYWTAEDMGMSPADMAVVAEETRYVARLDDGSFASGDPSPFTAEGIFRCIRSTVKHKFGAADLGERRVAIQGLGNVGGNLARLLAASGADLTVADIGPDRVKAAQQKHGAAECSIDAIHTANVDIFSPCAIGGVLNPATIPELNCKIVEGGANNKLADLKDAELLHERDILYAPDFVVNAGGIINVATEILQIADPKAWVAAKLAEIEATLSEILDEAKRNQITRLKAAVSFVENRLR